MDKHKNVIDKVVFESLGYRMRKTNKRRQEAVEMCIRDRICTPFFVAILCLQTPDEPEVSRKRNLQLVPSCFGDFSLIFSWFPIAAVRRGPCTIYVGLLAGFSQSQQLVLCLLPLHRAIELPSRLRPYFMSVVKGGPKQCLISKD